MASSQKALRFEAVTDGMKIAVTPKFLDEESAPAKGRFVWAYTIEMENGSDTTWTLTLRHWDIIDSSGRRQTVDGEGVVGQTPRLEPGDTFRYSSGAPLAAPSGMMSGSYTFVSDDGVEFIARVPAFSLDSPYDRVRPS